MPILNKIKPKIPNAKINDSRATMKVHNYANAAKKRFKLPAATSKKKAKLNIKAAFIDIVLF